MLAVQRKTIYLLLFSLIQSNPLFGKQLVFMLLLLHLITIITFSQKYALRTKTICYIFNQIYIQYSMSNKHLTIILIFCFLQASICILDQTYFKVLGIHSSQTNKENIHKAYTLAKSKLSSPQDQKQLKLLEEAYKTISDANLRQKYQRYNSIALKDLPKGTKQQAYDNRKGPLITMNVPITLQQIFNGGNLNLKYSKKSSCPKCEGFGIQNHKTAKPCNSCKGKAYEIITVDTRGGFKQKREQPCNRCKGSGKQPGTPCKSCQGKKIISEVANLTVPIQKGLPQGHTLVLKNFGDEKQIGAPSDLKLVFQQKNDGKWVRSKLNIEHNLQISLEEAIFGLKKQITHLDGRKFMIELNGPILPSTSHTIEGEGFSSKKDKSKKGDLVIRPVIILEKFDDDQLDLWESVFGTR